MMDAMYRGLHAGERPADALRSAKLSLIKAGGAFAHPYYWGPFQIYEGEGPPALQ
jgi:CHAT domain-containing protein